jgi:CubicO group peptidase (beta-lactamase class C family)
MWWVWDGPTATGPFNGAYTARGAIGQWITVLPAANLVIAHKTNSVYERTTSWSSYERLLELLFGAHGVKPAGEWPWRRAGASAETP